MAGSAGPAAQDRVEGRRHRRLRDDDRRVVLGQAELAVAGPPRGRQLGQARAQVVEPRGVDPQRRQVRLREVAVVVRVLLGPHDVGRLLAVVPAAGVLGEGLAPVERDRLALDLVGDRPLHGPERVHVLDLDPRPEGLGAARAERDVRLDPHLAALHVGIRHADRAQEQLQLLGVATRLLGGPDIRLGDDLHERRAGPVEVDEADPGPVRRGGVDELGRVLLEVGASDPDRDRTLRRVEGQLPG